MTIEQRLQALQDSVTQLQQQLAAVNTTQLQAKVDDLQTQTFSLHQRLKLVE